MSPGPSQFQSVGDEKTPGSHSAWGEECLRTPALCDSQRNSEGKDDTEKAPMSNLQYLYGSQVSSDWESVPPFLWWVGATETHPP